MTFDSLIHTIPSFINKGKNSCVITSRVRLARNISDDPFPGWATKEERNATYEKLHEAVSTLPLVKTGFFDELKTLDSVQKQVLIEQHLMSRELAARSEGCGLVVNKDKTVCIMLNEEDHLRLQAIQSGLNLKKAYNNLNRIDTHISKNLNYAYDRNLGYLTSCPTNVGTGMRASVMLHLPALAITEQITPVLKAVAKLGLAIRGFYGEGTESLGHLYQISNQSTLGETEQEIIARIERMVKQIISTEENARAKILAEKPEQLLDKIGRAYGTLKHAHIISSKETLNLLSLIRLGTEVSFFPTETLDLCDQLMIKSQPAHLQLHSGEKLDVDERDHNRAKIISSHLQNLNPPDIISNNLHQESPEEGDSLLPDHE